MKRLILAAAVATAMLALPMTAEAHTLKAKTAKKLAQGVCKDINALDPEENPYVCRRVMRAERRSRHALLVGLDLTDPEDGEECVAVIRVKYRSKKSRTVLALAAGHNCLADPFAGL